MRRLLVLSLLLCCTSAFGKDRSPMGIAFAQAKEGTWLCRKSKPEDALACAREQCAEQSPGQTCWATAWCFPAGWSGLMKVQLRDFSFTETLCGAPSQEALKQALRALCAGEEGAAQCELFNVVDPDGNERAVEGESYPGAPPAQSPPPEAQEP
jgi:hypothetical protein